MPDICDYDRLVVATDFGTTFSGVSYAFVEAGRDPRELSLFEVQSIDEFPNHLYSLDASYMRVEVPTVVLYPLDPGFRKSQQMEVDPSDDVQQITADNQNTGSYPAWDELLEDENDFRWGNQVLQSSSLSASYSTNLNRYIPRFKLCLDESPQTNRVRKELKAPLHDLKKRGVVDGPLRVIIDYLTSLLSHVKRELRDKDQKFEKCQVEIVFCVPPAWKPKGARNLQTCFAIALKEACFPGVHIVDNSIESCFVVSEPEAAATHMLTTQPSLQAGDTFVLIDAGKPLADPSKVTAANDAVGGGTVDATTYKIAREAPLRLSKEVVPPRGKLCGSSYVNEALRGYLLDLLKDETYLEDGNHTVSSIVDRVMSDQFEHHIKPNFNVFGFSHQERFIRFELRGVRDNKEKLFLRGWIHIPIQTIQNMFLERFKAISDIMKDQLTRATKAGFQVNHVVLVGGFSLSRSLQSHIEQQLMEFNDQNGCNIGFMVPLEDDRSSGVNAVAKGAVLRALDKNYGPERIARCSYGIGRHEEYMAYPEHKRMTCFKSVNGKFYVPNTIDWVIKKGMVVNPGWKREPLKCIHVFPLDEKKLVCRERLFVSDDAYESHLKETHRKNRSAEVVGEIVVDFTFLKDLGIVKPTQPHIEDGKTVVDSHYEIQWDAVFQAPGLNLDCIATYHYRDQNGEARKIEKKCTMSLVSMFAPSAT